MLLYTFKYSTNAIFIHVTGFKLEVNEYHV
jgi:hypothetical protein